MPHFYLSLYVIPWSRDMGSGHVALLRQRGADGTNDDMTLTDNPSLARAHQAVLRAIGYSRVDLSRRATAGELRAKPAARAGARALPDRRRGPRDRGALGRPGRGDLRVRTGARNGPTASDIWSMLFEAGRG